MGFWRWYKTNIEFKEIKKDQTGKFQDKYHFFVIQVIRYANPKDHSQKQYIVTSAENDGDKEMSWDEIIKIEPRLQGKEETFHIFILPNYQEKWVRMGCDSNTEFAQQVTQLMMESGEAEYLIKEVYNKCFGFALPQLPQLDKLN